MRESAADLELPRPLTAPEPTPSSPEDTGSPADGDFEPAGPAADVQDRGEAVQAGDPARAGAPVPAAHADWPTPLHGEELIVEIRVHRPGDRPRLTAERGGTEREISLVLGASEQN